MDLLASIPVTAVGILVAGGLVVAGAPLFAMGRRALVLRRVLGSLAERPLGRDLSGWVHVRGRVALLSPLFAPLTGRPCAGFQLEVSGENSRVGGMVSDWRPFRLEHEGASAFVSSEGAAWQAPVTGERSLPASEPLPERLAELLASRPETRWLRDRRATLHVVERALEAGAEVSVLGLARHEGVTARAEKVRLAATGTDDGLTMEVHASHDRRVSAAAELWIGSGEDVMPGVHVFTSAADASLLRPSRWRAALVGVGPLLTLVGLLYLARAAGPLVARRF
jgi:hypothetical protein